jgi:5-methylthioadenosine/S-adenosylhomocysteine deaminase
MNQQQSAHSGSDSQDLEKTVIHADAALTDSGIVAPAEVQFTGKYLQYVGPPVTASAHAVSLDGHVLMPSLVNAHTHSAMTLLRGVSDDDGFMPWLAEVQALEQNLTHDDVRAGVELAMLEMIASGTTAFADMYVWDESLLEIVKHSGMRVYAAVAINAPDVDMFPGVNSRVGREEIDYAISLHEKYRDDDQVRVGFGPHAPYSVPKEFFAEIIDVARRHGIPIHTHISESPAEIQQIQQREGMTPADYLASLGIFETDLLAAHCVHLTENEMDRFAAAGAALSHNPVSNMKLGNGVAPLPEFLRRNLRVALGTDSVASNNSLDLFEEIKFGTILHRGVNEDASAVRAADMLRLATAMDVIGFEDSGSLRAGKRADMIAVASPPSENLVSQLAFASNGGSVAQVWSGGEHLYDHGQFLTLDEADIRSRAANSASRIRRQ